MRDLLELLILTVDLAAELAPALLLDREIAPDVNDRVARVDDEPAGVRELDPDKCGRGGEKSDEQYGVRARNDVLPVHQRLQ